MTKLPSRIVIAFSICSLLLFSACEDPNIELTRTDRRLVDSLFQVQKSQVDREVDSLCKLWSREHLAAYKDSLMQQRWAEIRQILESNE